MGRDWANWGWGQIWKNKCPEYQGTHFQGSRVAVWQGGAGLGAAGELHFSLCPINLWVVSLQPVMPKDHHVGLSLSQQEVDPLLVVTNSHKQVYAKPDLSILVLRPIHIIHCDWVLQGGWLQSHSFCPL